MNQKKNRGFTLIELLAVIVILAIIALIAVPVIINIISKANESAFKDSAYGVISAGELYYAEQQLEPNGMTSDVTITLPDTTKTLQLKGEVPNGSILITKEGKVAISVYNNRYCVTKGIEDKDVTITEDYETCELILPEKTLSELVTTSTEVPEKPACLTDETECAPGTPVAIKVNEIEVYNFYVISEKDNEITLIMDRNLYSSEDLLNNSHNISWVSKEDYGDDTNYGNLGNNNKGPITAIRVLKERTSNWTNIPEKEYVYTDDNRNGENYKKFSETMRARMLTYSEATSKDVGCNSNSYSCPDWLYKNLSKTGDVNTQGYWLSTTYHSYDAYILETYGSYLVTSFNGAAYGLRPVITLTK